MERTALAPPFALAAGAARTRAQSLPDGNTAGGGGAAISGGGDDAEVVYDRPRRSVGATNKRAVAPRV